MMAIEEILARIEDQNERLRASLAADSDFGLAFNDLLSELLELGLDVRVVVRRRDPEQVLAEYRASGADQHAAAPDKKEVSSDDRAATSTVESWQIGRPRIGPSETDICIRRLGELANFHWGDRDPMTLLPYLKSAGTEKRVIAYALSQAGGELGIGVLHTDLDNFKAVNTEFGEPAGNKVLAEFADRLRLHFADIGIVTRTGGEEFSAVIVHDDPAQIFRRAERFRQSMQNDCLETIARPNTCSIGLVIYPDADIDGICSRFDDLVDDARNAERRAKAGGKNCIRLNGADGPPADASTATDLVRAAIEARVGLNGTALAYMRGDTGALLADMIATELVDAKAGEISARVQAMAQAIGLTFAQHPVPATGKPKSMSASMPVHDWAAAVAWGCLRSAYAGGKVLQPNDVLRFETSADESSGTHLFLCVDRGGDGVEHVRIGPCATPLVAPIVIGKPWYPLSNLPAGGIGRLEAERLGEGRSALSPCLLLPIGDAATALAKRMQHLVAEVVEIDDRPVIGGGLPDFWQSNVARVIRACLRNPNIKTIIALGKSENAATTLARLEPDGETWSRSMQRRLSISSENLQLFRDRTTTVVRIEDPSGEKTLNAILGATRTLAASSASLPVINLDMEAKRRRIPVPPPSEANRLLVTDGLRTGTLADAYPQAIDLLRASDAAPQTESTQRRFREFPSFKLVLTTPFIETVPDYWKGEEPALENYFELNFGRRDGLFGTPLHAVNESGISIYTHGIRTAVSAIGGGRPTRRIHLPVSSDASRFDQPLGLCAIQVMPRLRDGRWYLDFQWIWRTVEALVGFPFSAYGSITWSKDFFDAVAEEMRQSGSPSSVELGELTYLALSFHMFLDVGDTEIARAIVQDVSH
jgi:diguanylate cyclase (GGDEF)-like protein